jgi:hypothetical protein
MLFVLRRKASAWKPICLESLSFFLIFYEKPPLPTFPGRNMQQTMKTDPEGGEGFNPRRKPK